MLTRMTVSSSLDLMDAKKICAALGDALNSSPRPPALAALARVKYPMRELRPMMEADETMSISIGVYLGDQEQEVESGLTE